MTDLVELAKRCEAAMILHTKDFLALGPGSTKTAHRTAAAECAQIAAALRALAQGEG